jgi:SAM-dependent methyltransferase
MSDDSPFDGAEDHYARFRPGYGSAAIDWLVSHFDVDADGRVLDLGCGAGQLAVPLADHAGEVVAMDPNPRMLDHARERAADVGVANVTYREGSDADLGSLDGSFRLTTMGRAFHWMDQERTLEHLRDRTAPGGGVAIVTDDEWLTKARDPWGDVVYDVVADHLDDLPERRDPATIEYDDPWDAKLEAFGFDVETKEIPLERAWTVDELVGYVFSLSFASPQEFGDDRDAFEQEVRERLAAFGSEPFVQHTTVEILAGRR